MDEILKCDDSNESYWAVLCHCCCCCSTSFPGLFPFELGFPADPIQKGKALGTRLVVVVYFYFYFFVLHVRDISGKGKKHEGYLKFILPEVSSALLVASFSTKTAKLCSIIVSDVKFWKFSNTTKQIHYPKGHFIFGGQYITALKSWSSVLYGWRGWSWIETWKKIRHFFSCSQAVYGWVFCCCCCCCCFVLFYFCFCFH